MNKTDRKLIYDKFGGKCAYCGQSIELSKFHVDHIIPKEHYRVYFEIEKYKHNIPEFLSHLTINDCEHLDNKFPACSSCNLYKNSNSLIVFRMNISELVRQCRRTTQFRIAERFGLVKEQQKEVVFYFEIYETDKNTFDAYCCVS